MRRSSRLMPKDGKRERIDVDAHGRSMPAGDRDQSDAGELRQFRHKAGLDDVFDLGQLHRVRSDAKRQDRRVGRIDLGVDRRRRQIGGQKIAGGVDRCLHLLLGDVETDVEAEPQGDDRRAGGALRHHLAQARHLAELPLERRRHRRSHHLRARAWIKGLDLDRRIVDLGQGRERQEAKGHDADEHDRDHQKTGRDRTIDEDAGRVHRPASKRRTRHCAAPWAGAPDPLGAAPWLAPDGAAPWVGRRASGRLEQPRPRWPGQCVGRGRRTGRSAGRLISRPRLVVTPPMMLPGALGGPSPSEPRSRAGAGLPAPCGRMVHDLDLRAVAQPVDAVDHHLVACREARGDHRMLAVGRSDGDVALGDRRIVVEEIDEIARRPELDRRVGRERRAGHRVDQKTDIDELVREQDPVRIVERRPHPDRAGGHVDLAVVGGQRPSRQRVDIVAVKHRNRKLGAGIEPRRDARQIAPQAS